jgi:hypothetical protein
VAATATLSLVFEANHPGQLEGALEPADAENSAGQNRESWREVIEFYEEMVQSPQWAFVAPLLTLARQFAATERAERFRAGQSVLTLVISTAPQHGLRPGEPFVTVEALG